MQLSRNISHKPVTNLSAFFILTYYYMVFKMALLLVLEKKEMYLYFQLENNLRLFEVMKMITRNTLE